MQAISLLGWGPRQHTKERVNWATATAFLPLCFLTVDVMRPVPSCSCYCDVPTITDCALQMWATVNLPWVAVVRFLVTGVRKVANPGELSAKLKWEPVKEEKKAKKPPWQRQVYFRISLREVPIGGGKKASFFRERAQSLLRTAMVVVKVGCAEMMQWY